MFNTGLQDQLKDLKEAGLLKVKYPAGYQKWKTKFDYWFDITKDVQQTLDIIYGHGGSVTNYRGSLYRNSNLDMNGLIKAQRKGANKK